jgi:NTP pyrophosphatase (non-canonical NTP hydrolase)
MAIYNIHINRIAKGIHIQNYHYNNYMNVRRNLYMIEKIGEPAMLEQLAEESVELAKACLKLARKLRGENPTPKSKAECQRELLEEFTDVIQCSRELKLQPDEEQIEEKRLRFLTRWTAATQSKIDSKKRHTH